MAELVKCKDPQQPQEEVTACVPSHTLAQANTPTQTHANNTPTSPQQKFLHAHSRAAVVGTSACEGSHILEATPSCTCCSSVRDSIHENKKRGSDNRTFLETTVQSFRLICFLNLPESPGGKITMGMRSSVRGITSGTRVYC